MQTIFQRELLLAIVMVAMISSPVQQVYIAESSQGYHKIGISKHPDRRARQLSIPGIVDLYIVHTVPAQFARRAERVLHDSLREYRVNSEWFRLPDDLLRTLCEVEGEHDLLLFCGVFG
jgi:hypothetical protein